MLSADGVLGKRCAFGLMFVARPSNSPMSRLSSAFGCQRSGSCGSTRGDVGRGAAWMHGMMSRHAMDAATMEGLMAGMG